VSSELIIDGYEFTALIGRGAGGAVYQVRHLGSLEIFAAKEFSQEGGQVQGFLKELSALMSLNHPNVIGCKGLVYGQGRNYLMLEFANQGSLRSRLVPEQPLPTESVLEMFTQIVEGLAHAHAQGILHCDLKPENILISNSVCKLADLGLAQTKSQNADQEIRGTPLYMAPEQFYDRCTEASDLYSIGIMLFEAVSGHLPFEGEIRRLFFSHSKEEPNWALLGSSPLAELIKELLAKDPAHRPTSAQNVLLRFRQLQLSPEKDPHDTRGIAERTRPQIVRLQLQTIGRQLVPGAERVWGGGDNLIMSDGRITDLYRISKKKWMHAALNESLVAASLEVELEGRWIQVVSTRKAIFEFDLARRKFTKLFDIPRPASALRLDAEFKQVLMTDGRRISSFSLDGKLKWSEPSFHYALMPHLCPLPDGGIVVSEGATLSSLVAYDRRGKVQWRRSFASPLLCCLESRGEVGAVEMELGHQHGIAFHRILSADGELLETQVLCEGVFGSKVHDQAFSLYHTDRRVSLWNFSAERLDQVSLDGDVLDDVLILSKEEGNYFLLEKVEHRSYLRKYSVHTKKEAVVSEL
jgi:hypothetical protein